MSVTDLELQGSARIASRRPLTAVIGVLATSLLVAAASWGWYWRTHPELFPGDGNGIGATFDSSRTAIYIGVTYPYPREGEQVTIASATPRILENSAGASFDFYVCTFDPARKNAASLGSAWPRQFAKICPEPVPVVDGTVLDVGSDEPQQLVMRISVERPGVVRTQGVALTYSHGWQRGTQAIGEHVKITYR
ncbi:MAG TPA: hypothetical protein VLI04_09775 [Nocardioidaceae bacterium]|nr:hypothetical protein [Nocardioidaceae bacterium]